MNDNIDIKSKKENRMKSDERERELFFLYKQRFTRLNTYIGLKKNNKQKQQQKKKWRTNQKKR